MYRPIKPALNHIIFLNIFHKLIQFRLIFFQETLWFSKNAKFKAKPKCLWRPHYVEYLVSNHWFTWKYGPTNNWKLINFVKCLWTIADWSVETVSCWTSSTLATRRWSCPPGPWWPLPRLVWPHFCKFFIMLTEFDKNISDWSHDCTDHKNGNDFFTSLVKWPKIVVKKKPIFFRNFRNKSCSILMLHKIDKNKKVAPKLIFFNEKCF